MIHPNIRQIWYHFWGGMRNHCEFWPPLLLTLSFFLALHSVTSHGILHILEIFKAHTLRPTISHTTSLSTGAQGWDPSFFVSGFTLFLHIFSLLLFLSHPTPLCDLPSLFPSGSWFHSLVYSALLLLCPLCAQSWRRGHERDRPSRVPVTLMV